LAPASASISRLRLGYDIRRTATTFLERIDRRSIGWTTRPGRLNLYRSSALLLILANTFHPTRSVHTALPGVPQKEEKTDEPEPDWTLTEK